MCEVNLDYETFVTYEKGKKSLYVLILKEIYGMIDSALLWYDLFSTTLLDLEFKLNPYERCIINKLIDEQKFPIGWFVGDNKVSHMDYNVNSMIADKIEEILGSYLAQQEIITYSLVWTSILLSEKFVVSTPHHIDEDLEDFGKNLKGNAVSPVTSQLFTITSEAKDLDDKKRSVITQ